MSSGIDGTVKIDRLFVHLALKQTNATAVLDIYRRNDEHSLSWMRRSVRSFRGSATRSLGSSPDGTDRQTDDRSRCWRRTSCHNLSWLQSSKDRRERHKRNEQNKRNRRW